MALLQRLPPASYVARGTAYEERCLAFLRQFTFFTSLQRVGGAGDKGVDIRGIIAPADRHLIAQCKSSSRPISSDTMREFQGTLSVESANDPVGILFGASGFRAEPCRQVMAMPTSVILFHLLRDGSDDTGHDGSQSEMRLSAVLLNKPARRLLKPLVEIRSGIHIDGRPFVHFVERLRSDESLNE